MRRSVVLAVLLVALVVGLAPADAAASRTVRYVASTNASWTTLNEPVVDSTGIAPQGYLVVEATSTRLRLRVTDAHGERGRLVPVEVGDWLGCLRSGIAHDFRTTPGTRLLVAVLAATAPSVALNDQRVTRCRTGGTTGTLQYAT